VILRPLLLQLASSSEFINKIWSVILILEYEATHTKKIQLNTPRIHEKLL